MWAENYGYDRYGNRWVASTGGLPASGLTPTVDVYNGANRMNATQYDGAGNQTQIGANTLVYEAENHVSHAYEAPSAGGRHTQYVYGGDGRRVMKITENGPTQTYVYDIFGTLVAEYSSQPSGTPPPCNTCYVSTDHLGNTRMVTDGNHVVVARHDYTPFGEEIPGGVCGTWTEWGGYDAVNQKFTGKERDQETGLDFSEARYLSSAQGRFTSPDEPLRDQYASDPQSWNLYTYVRNNPLKNTDPSGLDCITTCNQSYSGVTVVTELGGSSKTCSGTYVNGTVDTTSYEYNGTSLTYSFASDTASGAGTISFGSSQSDNGDINSFGLAVIQAVGRQTNSAYGLMGTFAGGSLIAGAGLAASPAIGGAVALSDFIPQIANFGSKQAARVAIQAMKLTPAQAPAALSAISRATSTSSIQVLQQGQTLVVNIARAGANGYQVVQSVIDQTGNKQVVQKTFDAANTLVHYDPKN